MLSKNCQNQHLQLNYMNFKKYLVVMGPEGEFEIWTSVLYNKYINDAVSVGAGSAYKVITHFDGNESLLSQEQPSTDEWVPIARRLEELRPLHIAPYNLGDMGETHDLIMKLAKLLPPLPNKEG